MTNADDRMLWIRVVEQTGADVIADEYEIASECRIFGVLNYEKEKILSGPLTFEKDENDLLRYLVRVRYPANLDHLDVQKNVRAAHNKGYYFRGGVIDELVSLFSLYFQCRFWKVASYDGALTEKSIKYKEQHQFLYKKSNPQLHPKIFDIKNNNRNFGIGLDKFLNKVRRLPSGKHHDFIFACYHYVRALREVGIDNEMVFIRLVSAIEILAKHQLLNKKDHPLYGLHYDKIVNASLSSELHESLKSILKFKKGIIRPQKAKMQFIKFIESHSTGWFKGGNYKAKQLKIKKADLKKWLGRIYDARSAYLHSGEPMYLSIPMNIKANWDMDATLGRTIDNRKISGDKKLPYAYWFEDLVRYCLLKYLDLNAK